MGININLLRGLLVARALGADFTRPAMLGRQSLNLSVAQLRRVLEHEFRQEVSAPEIQRIHQAGYAEELFRFLGAQQSDSFDNSGFESATHVLDFNLPLPEPLRQRYTLAVDGGTLEHVFNFPQALRNGMELLAPGGFFIANPPANNCIGHGFYQLSPELYFRVFSEANGYRIRHMFLYEGRESDEWFAVADPEQVRARVGYPNAEPTFLLVVAERIAVKPIFAVMPQQSDYVEAWDQGRAAAGPAAARFPAWRLRVPGWFKKGVRKLVHGYRNPRHFQRIDYTRIDA